MPWGALESAWLPWDSPHCVLHSFRCPSMGRGRAEQRRRPSSGHSMQGTEPCLFPGMRISSGSTTTTTRTPAACHRRVDRPGEGRLARGETCAASSGFQRYSAVREVDGSCGAGPGRNWEVPVDRAKRMSLPPQLAGQNGSPELLDANALWTPRRSSLCCVLGKPSSDARE